MGILPASLSVSRARQATRGLTFDLTFAICNLERYQYLDRSFDRQGPHMPVPRDPQPQVLTLDRAAEARLDRIEAHRLAIGRINIINNVKSDKVVAAADNRNRIFILYGSLVRIVLTSTYKLVYELFT